MLLGSTSLKCRRERRHWLLRGLHCRIDDDLTEGAGGNCIAGGGGGGMSMSGVMPELGSRLVAVIAH